MHELAFEAFGVRAVVTTSAPEELERVHGHLPPGWQPCSLAAVDKRFAILSDATGGYELSVDGKRWAHGLDLDFALVMLEGQVRAHVALHAPDRIFVHAGVVGHRGRAIVIPGMSFSGKTTLVAALVRAGAAYYSDELAPLDEDGLVHPYPKPLSLRDHRQVQHDHDAHSMGATTGEEPLPIGAIVTTTYAPGAQWRPRRLSPGEGVLALLSHTLAAQTRPEQVVRFLSRAVDGAVLIESPRDDAPVLAPLLLAEVER